MAIPADIAMALPSLNGTQPSNTAGGMKQIRQAAQEFESVFLSTMLQQMFSGVKTDGPFGGGHGEEMFRSLLIEEYGSSIAAAGGIGVADEVARELLSIQEANQ